jgi:GTP cyclohydrolase I
LALNLECGSMQLKAGLRKPAYLLRTRKERPLPAAICRVPNGIRPPVMMSTITRIKMVVFDILNSGHTAKRPEKLLRRTFDETAGYDEIVTLRDIPFTGFAHVGYLPNGRGISKMARVADALAKRLQIQERLTAQIADVIEKVLQPQGSLWS